MDAPASGLAGSSSPSLVKSPRDLARYAAFAACDSEEESDKPEIRDMASFPAHSLACPGKGEDAYCGVSFGNRYLMYGVFDGHSDKDIAYTIAESLPEDIFARIKQGCKEPDAIQSGFAAVEQKLWAQDTLGGSTALIVLVDKLGKKLFTGHVGDSRAMLVTERIASAITQDHKASNPAECARIKQKRFSEESAFIHEQTRRLAGVYRVSVPGRKHNGMWSLDMSRSLGDTAKKLHAGIGVISAEPDIAEYAIPGDAQAVILGSDGFWNGIERVDADPGSITREILTKTGSMHAVAQKLVAKAVEHGVVDDTTVIVAPITPTSLQ